MVRALTFVLLITSHRAASKKSALSYPVPSSKQLTIVQDIASNGTLTRFLCIPDIVLLLELASWAACYLCSVVML